MKFDKIKMLTVLKFHALWFLCCLILMISSKNHLHIDTPECAINEFKDVHLYLLCFFYQLFIPVYTCLFLFILVYSCLCLFILEYSHVYSHLYSFVSGGSTRVSPFLNLKNILNLKNKWTSLSISSMVPWWADFFHVGKKTLII